MDTFFGVSTGLIALGALALLGAALGMLGYRAWRWPVFLRLGVRQLPRRPTQTALIVSGLTLSSALVAASLTTGDTLTHALRTVAVNELGPLDELVWQSRTTLPGTTPTPGGDNPFTSTAFFPLDTYTRVAREVASDGALRADVAGLAPALRLGCTMDV
jgi:putative ABC transport system permease protein